LVAVFSFLEHFCDGPASEATHGLRVECLEIRHQFPPQSPHRIEPVERNFKFTKPDAVWMGDVAYVPADGGWLSPALFQRAFLNRFVA